MIFNLDCTRNCLSAEFSQDPMRSSEHSPDSQLDLEKAIPGIRKGNKGMDGKKKRGKEKEVKSKDGKRKRQDSIPVLLFPLPAL